MIFSKNKDIKKDYVKRYILQIFILGAFYMKTRTLSNRFLFLLALASVSSLTACMQDQVQTNYSSDVRGYEDSVEAQSVKEAMSSKPAYTISPANVPVIVNNAYSQGNAIVAAAGQPGGYQAPANSNPYGSLNGQVIQAGVFSPGYAPYQAPSAYGSNIYSPTR